MKIYPIFRYLGYSAIGVLLIASLAWWAILNPGVKGDQFVVLAALSILFGTPACFISLFISGFAANKLTKRNQTYRFILFGCLASLLIAIIALFVHRNFPIISDLNYSEIIFAGSYSAVLVSLPVFILWAFFEKRTYNKSLKSGTAQGTVP